MGSCSFVETVAAFRPLSVCSVDLTSVRVQVEDLKGAQYFKSLNKVKSG